MASGNSITYERFLKLLDKGQGRRMVAIFEAGSVVALYSLCGDNAPKASKLETGKPIKRQHLTLVREQVFVKRRGCLAGELPDGLTYEVIGDDARLMFAFRQMNIAVR